MADIVVYGGGFAGVAAAAKAATNAPNKKIALIIPDPVDHNGNGSCLGGLGTIGGQNFFDQKKWKDDLPTKGSYAWWSSKGVRQHYNTDEMAALLKSDLSKYNIDYYYGYDIENIGWTAPANITQVNLRRLKRDPVSGFVVWESTNSRVSVPGTVFIDASESGRLAQLSNFGGTVGRYDWPTNTLDADERGNTGKARQQVATLMFKVTNFDRTVISEDLKVASHSTGVYSATGGKIAYATNKTIINFNNKWGPLGFALKPFNMAQNGPEGSNPLATEWWVNMLLVFDVDGRAHERDRNNQDSNKAFPKDMRDGYRTVDEGWADARAMLENEEFLPALQAFPGFKYARLVKDSDGKPVVGKILYLRETIHSALDSSARANGTENSNYALKMNACKDAGAATGSGSDSGNHASRIGLNFYLMDINAYKFEDLKDANGTYIWGTAINKKIRGIETEPTNPVYVPFNAITTNFVCNLLIPGYAACISSFAWAEARTLPNQCVLGDAAGVTAAYAVNNNKLFWNFGSTDIDNVQTILRNSGARLDK